jgi:hypothetical protein
MYVCMYICKYVTVCNVFMYVCICVCVCPSAVRSVGWSVGLPGGLSVGVCLSACCLPGSKGICIYMYILHVRTVDTCAYMCLHARTMTIPVCTRLYLCKCKHKDVHLHACS